MKIQKRILFIGLLIGGQIFAQDTINKIAVTSREPLTKRQFLDSLKTSFVHDKIASCIDSMWMKEMVSLDLYDELTLDIKNIDIDQTVDYELPTELLKERLKVLDQKSPFNIEYNIGLENVIKSFLKNRKRAFERLMGVSQFYFPVFEEALAAQNIPLEIKYLAVVESALNPRAVSRVGATGLWQFMYQTGKQYELKINSYVDERSDPLKASNAATQYMNNMYNIFGDWDLVLASYNSGPGNVAKAIRRSGGKQNYWNIRKNLPKETQGYLPAFLATMYIFEYHKEHGIKPNKAIANHFATDTVLVKRSLTFKQLSDLLDIPVAELQFFNPSYKRDEIPYITGQEHFLRLPLDKIAIFTSNEEKIYAFANYEDSFRERPYSSNAIVSRDSINTERRNNRFKFHRVKRGDSLSEISNRYGVTISQIKEWNHLRGTKAPVGKKLKIYYTANETIAQQTTKKDSVPTKTNATVTGLTSSKAYKEEKVVTFKDVVKLHKVKRGDNLGEIANRFGVTVAEVKKWNKIKGSNIVPGQSLKIVKNERVVTTVKKEIKNIESKSETAIAASNGSEDVIKNPQDYYEVQQGDNLFSIAKKFNLSVEQLKELNSINDENVKLGSKLALAYIAEKENVEPKTEIKTIEYTVEKGDNLGSIAKKHNVAVSDIKDWNNLEDNNIKIGSKLVVSKKLLVVSDSKTTKTKKDAIAENEKESFRYYLVKKGDSLFSIAKKYPGMTISEIKKLNGIKNESLKPGMKLKISG
jgi:membrane-bound lytic murein transglycosylase D